LDASGLLDSTGHEMTMLEKRRISIQIEDFFVVAIFSKKQKEVKLFFETRD
jgi:hypothetical protein